jgi:hypothetical protein
MKTFWMTLRLEKIYFSCRGNVFAVYSSLLMDDPRDLLDKRNFPVDRSSYNELYKNSFA